MGEEAQVNEEFNEETFQEEVSAALEGEEQVVEEAVEETEEAEETAELSAEEEEAIAKGWKPEGVEGKPNLSAGEFLRNESFYKEIHKLKRELRGQQEVVDALKEHNKQTQQKAYEKAVKDLKDAKKLAAKDENLELMVELDEQLEDLRDAKSESVGAEEQPPQAGLTEADFAAAYNDFTRSNVWYGRNRDMTMKAEEIYEQYSSRNPTALPEDRFEYLMTEIRKSFPEEFANQKRSRPASVATPAKSGKVANSKKTMKDVNEADRAIARTLIKSGVMTEAEYLADYFQD